MVGNEHFNKFQVRGNEVQEGSARSGDEAMIED